MTKNELLALDVLSLQKLIVQKTKVKERLEIDIARLHKKHSEEREESLKPLTDLERRYGLLLIEGESLTVQIAARKKELTSLEQMHNVVHRSFAEENAKKSQKVADISAQIDSKKAEISILDKSLIAKQVEVVSITAQIQTLSFEVTNYQKTIVVASNQLKEIMAEIRGKTLIERKLNAVISQLKKTLNVTAEHILTERNKRLWLRHKQRTGMNKSLDVQIERKRKQLK